MPGSAGNTLSLLVELTTDPVAPVTCIEPLEHHTIAPEVNPGEVEPEVGSGSDLVK